MFEGSPNTKEIKLPKLQKEGGASLTEALNERKSIRDYSDKALTLDEVSQVLWAAYGKNKWGRLTSPSAGALYPLTIYLGAGKIDGLAQGFYKYNNRNHSLVLVSDKDLRSSLSRAALGQAWVRNAPAVIVICANYEITASSFRYGTRGRRYVDIEVGHVGQNIYLQATALDLGTVAVGAFSDREVKKVLNIKEDPLYIMPLGELE